MRTLITTIFVLAFLPLVSLAQIYTGEAPTETSKQDDEPNEQQSKGGAFKTSFVHLAYFMPSMTPKQSYHYGPFKNGAAPKWGLMFESGAIRFFDENFMFNGVGNLGLYSSFGFGASIHDFNEPENFEGVKVPFFFADLKLGPDLRLEFIDFAKVDLYANIGVLASYGGFVGNINQDDTFYKPTKPVIAFQTGLGLNVALGRFVLGLQYTMANGGYEFDVSEDPAVYPDGPDEETQQYDVNLNSLRLHIGIYTEKRRR